METYTISIDSSQSTKNTTFQIDLSGSVTLTNISKVEVLRASVSTISNASAIYLYIDELSDNRFNRRVSKLTSNFDDYIKANAGAASGQTFDNTYLRGSIVSWNPETSPRSTFTQNRYWDAYVIYDKTKDSLSTLTVSLYNQLGAPLPESGSDVTYLTLRFTCKLPTPLATPAPEPIISSYEAAPKSKPDYAIYIIIILLSLLTLKSFVG